MVGDRASDKVSDKMRKTGCETRCNIPSRADKTLMSQEGKTAVEIAQAAGNNEAVQTLHTLANGVLMHCAIVLVTVIVWWFAARVRAMEDAIAADLARVKVGVRCCWCCVAHVCRVCFRDHIAL